MNGTGGALGLASRERLDCRYEDDPKPKHTGKASCEAREPDWSTIPTEWHAPMAPPPPAVPAPRDANVNAATFPALPSAPNAMHGAVLAWLAKDVPHVDRTDLARSFSAGDYRLHAHVQKQSDGTDAVLYWTAFNVKTKRAEFLVGPDALKQFASNPGLYVDAAARSAIQGVPSRPYEVESQRVVESLMNEGPGAALQHLGSAWNEAIHDPEWWTKTTVNLISSAGPALVARGAGAATLTAEATPEVSQATRVAAEGAARNVLTTARAAEPQITRAVSAVAEANGGKMVGLEARLKTESSLARKIATDAGEPAKVEASAARLKDVVRYTAGMDAPQYGSGYRAVVKELEAQGYELQSLKNTWPTNGYRGVNASFRSPSGQVFELQFHTPESFAAKSEVHALYEEWRAPGTSLERRAALERTMSERFRAVPIPPGAFDVRILERLASQGVGILVDALQGKGSP